MLSEEMKLKNSKSIGFHFNANHRSYVLSSISIVKKHNMKFITGTN